MANHLPQRQRKRKRVKKMNPKMIAEVLTQIRTIGNRLGLLWVTALFIEDGQLKLVAGISKTRIKPDGEEKFVISRVEGSSADTVMVAPAGKNDASILMQHKVIACCIGPDDVVAYTYVTDDGRVRVCARKGCAPDQHFSIGAEPVEFRFVDGTLVIKDAEGTMLEPIQADRSRVGGSGLWYPAAVV